MGGGSLYEDFWCRPERLSNLSVFTCFGFLRISPIRPGILRRVRRRRRNGYPGRIRPNSNRPIRKILAQRKEKIGGLELSIDTSDKDALEKEQAFAAGIKEARARGLKEKEELVQQGTEEEKAVIAEITRKAQAELAEIRDKIKNDADVVRDTLQKEVDNFADQICQKILGRTV